ncbi:SRPBCC family protein [Hymenobacter ruricola]|uniref:SRPBCC family protein n=1 Tax=Hymenobacter ruricola TaxID=2791023 RepID=A0ABS0I9N8_9BACT|nr:hypothetical protein [Hymenobacter ruricola]MBF9223677.1 hypothetical protein [Hymenobacter ruricola]
MPITRTRVPYFLAVGIGLLYAFVARFILGEPFINDNGLLTGSFLLITPVAIGALTAHYLPPTEGKWRRLVVAPFFAVMLFLFCALLFHLEGFICIAIIGPLYLLLAFFGAFIYSAIADLQDKKDNKTLVVAAFALLPFITAPLENQFNNPDDFRRVENIVLINAPAAVVWQHIIRVAPIPAQDLGPSLIDDIGFPRPIEATLTHEGVGGVRHATFERGVEFIETVDDWQPLRRLSFSIAPNTATIPPTTFDEHVIVGGRFFDVLRGTYELQPAGPGRTRLVLYSEQRLSTHLNWYAGLWTGYVMSEIQGRILAVLRRRCEAPAATAWAVPRPARR